MGAWRAARLSHAARLPRPPFLSLLSAAAPDRYWLLSSAEYTASILSRMQASGRPLDVATLAGMQEDARRMLLNGQVRQWLRVSGGMSVWCW